MGNGSSSDGWQARITDHDIESLVAVRRKDPRTWRGISTCPAYACPFHDSQRRGCLSPLLEENGTRLVHALERAVVQLRQVGSHVTLRHRDDPIGRVAGLVADVAFDRLLGDILGPCRPVYVVAAEW
jgi:hypothetical protein